MAASIPQFSTVLNGQECLWWVWQQGHIRHWTFGTFGCLYTLGLEDASIDHLAWL